MTPKFIKLTTKYGPRFFNVGLILHFSGYAYGAPIKGSAIFFSDQSDDDYLEVTETPAEILALIEKP